MGSAAEDADDTRPCDAFMKPRGRTTRTDRRRSEFSLLEAELRIGVDGARAIGLRAEVDALPVVEKDRVALCLQE
jgi:hypothetical protein